MTIFYMIWSSFSTSLIVYPNAMNSINPEIIEAAHIDGVQNQRLCEAALFFVDNTILFGEVWHIVMGSRGGI